jgi:hypothetical protein
LHLASGLLLLALVNDDDEVPCDGARKLEEPRSEHNKHSTLAVITMQH